MPTSGTQPIKPAVCVGMPVYNGEAKLEAAINSILNQTYSNFELLISDNSSTDRTAEICKSFAQKDKRIRYFRQPATIPIGENFTFVYEKATCEYFMWAADDDIRSAKFLEKNLNFLEQHQDYSFSSSPCFGEDEDVEHEKLHIRPLDGPLYSRLTGFMDICWQSHAVTFALFRHAALKDFKNMTTIQHALDWSINMHLLSKGKFGAINDEYVILGATGVSHQPGYVASQRTKQIHRIFPFYDFSKRLIKIIVHADELTWKEKTLFLLRLLQFNTSVQMVPAIATVVRFLKKILGKTKPDTN